MSELSPKNAKFSLGQIVVFCSLRLWLRIHCRHRHEDNTSLLAVGSEISDMCPSNTRTSFCGVSLLNAKAYLLNLDFNISEESISMTSRIIMLQSAKEIVATTHHLNTLKRTQRWPLFIGNKLEISDPDVGIEVSYAHAGVNSGSGSITHDCDPKSLANRF